jgi:citrate lyase gamma subunit
MDMNERKNKITVNLTEKALSEIIEKEKVRDIELTVNDYYAFDTIMRAAERTRDGSLNFKVVNNN